MIHAYLHLLPISLVQGLVYGLVALAVMIPFRLLNLPDLSCEGTFPAGAAVCATAIAGGLPPLLATLLGVAAGAAGGAITALLHLRLRIHSLLAGILLITMVWSVNLRVMGTSNRSIYGGANLFDQISPRILLSPGWQIAVFGVVAAVVVLALRWFLATEIGLGLRGVGNNLVLAPALGLHNAAYTLFALALANGLTGLAGALVAQMQGYADVSMGFGVLVNALAAVIVGEALLGSGTGRLALWRLVAAPVAGAVVYYQLVAVALALGLPPTDLRLATGLFVIATLGLPLLLRHSAGRQA